MSEEANAVLTKSPVTPCVVTSILVALTLAIFVSCGGGGGGGSPTGPASPTITSVSVSCNPTSVQVGQTSQCTATVMGTGSYSSAVAWSVSAGSINSSGLLTAPSTAGTVTVTAASTQDPSKKGTATVTVTSGVTISVTPQYQSVTLSSSVRFQASVVGTSNTNVAWSLVGPGFIGADGTYTAPDDLPSTTTAQITATSTADPNERASANVNLLSAVAVGISPVGASVIASSTKQFSAVVTGSNDHGVTWTATGGGSVDGAGLYTAPPTVSTPTEVTISATAIADPSRSATASLTVIPMSQSSGGFQVSSTFPSDGSTGISQKVVIHIALSDDLDITSLNAQNAALIDASGQPVPLTLAYDPTSRVITTTPQVTLGAATSYKISVGTGLQGASGDKLSSLFTASFATVPLGTVSAGLGASEYDRTPATAFGYQSSTGPVASDGSFTVKINPAGVTIVLVTFSGRTYFSIVDLTPGNIPTQVSVDDLSTATALVLAGVGLLATIPTRQSSSESSQLGSRSADSG